MVNYLPHQTFHQYMCVPDKCSVMLFRGVLVLVVVGVFCVLFY